MKPSLILYGANGFSAKLILEKLISAGVKPVLAGRNQIKIAETARKYGYEFKVFDLSNRQIVVESIKGFHTLLNCAGPFKYTAQILIDACLDASVNYIDITGEIPVIEYAWEMNNEALRKNIVIIPSAGFDVIPTDCLAKKLSEKLPSAEILELGLLNKKGKISRGTMITTLEMAAEKGKVRIDENLVDSRIGEYSVKLNNEKFKFHGISIPWGDVASAFYSTGIPNIKVYLGLPALIFHLRKPLLLLAELLKIRFLRDFLKWLIYKIKSESEEYDPSRAQVLIWGRVTDKNGESYLEVYRIEEGYSLTAVGATDIVIKVLNNEVKPGTHTPSQIFGSEYFKKCVIEKII